MSVHPRLGGGLWLSALLWAAAACSGELTSGPPQVSVAGDAATVSATTATGFLVTDLGMLPGGTTSAALAINNRGQIVGTSNDQTSTSPRQVIWSGGTIRPITPANPNPGPALHPAINDSREIVSWVNGGPSPTTGFATTNASYWNPSGASLILPSLPGGQDWVLAYDINSAGLIVGESRDATPLDRHAVVWNRSTLVRDLGLMGPGNPLTGGETSGRGINDLGDIVGRATVGIGPPNAFLWRTGVFTDLGPGEAVDINDSGLIAGNCCPFVFTAWVWQNGVRSDLPHLPGRPGDYIVSALNNHGDLVGSAPQPLAGTFGATIAVLWRAGQVVELGNFPGGDRSRALGVNDLGQIVGAGNVAPGGALHALLWTLANTVPTVTLTATSATSIRKGGQLSVRGSFIDPDFGPWTYTFNWGNGTTSGSVTSQGDIVATRTFPRTGRYRVFLKVIDARGATGASSTIEVRVR